MQGGLKVTGRLPDVCISDPALLTSLSDNCSRSENRVSSAVGATQPWVSQQQSAGGEGGAEKSSHGSRCPQWERAALSEASECRGESSLQPHQPLTF